MAGTFKPNDRVGEILAIFAIIFFVFVIFLSGITNLATTRNKNFYQSKIIDVPFRGSIYLSDAKTVAQSIKKYYLAIDSRYIKQDKLKDFTTILSLYLSIPQKSIKKYLDKKRRVVISKNINAFLAKDLIRLSHVFDKMGFFKSVHSIRRGLEVAINKIERDYPYKDLLEPVLGKVNENTKRGIVGLESNYNATLFDVKTGYYKAKRDVVGNLIFNQNAHFREKVNGNDIVLTVDSVLQKKTEEILDKYKTNLDAKEAVALIMDSKTGDLLTIASSNRYNPKKLEKSDVKNMNISAIQHLFEPGSVIKGIVFSGLIEENLVNLYEIVKGYNGRMKLGRKWITDEHKKEYFTAEEGVIYSSNIVMAQLAQRFSEYAYKNLLENFDLHRKSGIDLSYERISKLPRINKLSDKLIKATLAYGYGISLNLLQLAKAYNAFNNDGVIIVPKLVKKIAFEDQKPFVLQSEEKRAISSVTARKMLGILRKVVTRGTGKRANIEGVFIAGKTGTAHISIKGEYQKEYHSSFVGFANEISGNKKFTIAILVIKPKKQHFASLTAVPIFRDIVLMMIKEKKIKVK